MLIILAIWGTAWGESPEEAVKARSLAWVKAFNAGDTKTLAGLYTTDGKLLPPNSDVVQGRESIEMYWTLFIEGVKGKLKIQEALVQGDLAHLIGSFTVVDGQGKVSDRGKYVEIWKRVSGQWELYLDIWNTSLPKSAPAMP